MFSRLSRSTSFLAVHPNHIDSKVFRLVFIKEDDKHHQNFRYGILKVQLLEARLVMYLSMYRSNATIRGLTLITRTLFESNGSLNLSGVDVHP